MALIAMTFLFVVGTLGTVFSRLLTDEFKAWIPGIIRVVIRRAVVQLPSAQQERFEEEWQSHVNEVPGDIGKLIVAVGFLMAACKMTSGLKAGRAPLTVLLKTSSAAAVAPKGLGEQMNLLAAKLLDYSYVFPPLGRTITSSERDEALKYYNGNIRPELESLLLKFREQEGQLLEEDVCVYCEYHNFEKYVEITHLHKLLFGRHAISEMASQLALLALRVGPSDTNKRPASGHCNFTVPMTPPGKNGGGRDESYN